MNKTQSAPPTTWLLQHLPLAATFFFFIMLGVKLFVVASFNVEAALGILRAAGPVTVAVGTFITSLSGLSYGTLLGSFLWLQRNWEGDEKPLVFALMMVVAVVSGLVMVLTYVAVWIIPSVVAPFAGGWLRKRHEKAGTHPGTSWRVVVTVAALILMTQVLTRDVWLPRENLRLSDGDQGVFYVIEDEGRWVTVLSSETRNVQSVEESDIVEREICYFAPETSIWSIRLIDLAPVGRTNAEGRPECVSEDT